MICTPQFRRLFLLTLLGGGMLACGRDAGPGGPITGIAAPTAASRDRAVLQYGQREIGSMTEGSWHQIFNASTCAPRAPLQVSALFGPAGGTLTFGDSRLIIPGGALRDTVTISATLPGGTSTNVEFAPHGLQFAKSAGLVLSTVSCELADPVAPAVVYLSPEGEVLEYISAIYDPRWKAIAAPIDHFSGYAIAF